MYQQQKWYGSTKTDSTGVYRLENVKNGSYYVAFIYDTSAYSVTKYKQSGVDESENSDVIENQMLGKTCATTDVINVTSQNVDGINAGFTSNSVFDLSLKKSVTKITVKNEEGTKEYSYNKEQLAKVEIPAKYLQNTTVDIEYLIEVTNEGEIPGYAGDIVDYKPSDLDFNKDSNSGWSAGKDGNLHNASLSNTSIAPGETKTLTLKLSKKLSSNDGTGTKSNIAEIAAASNEYSASDKDSTPGNKKDKEDDMGKAEVIIGVKTGLVTITILVVSIVLAILIPTAIIIFKKRKGGQDGIKTI